MKVNLADMTSSSLVDSDNLLLILLVSVSSLISADFASIVADFIPSGMTPFAFTLDKKLNQIRINFSSKFLTDPSKNLELI